MASASRCMVALLGFPPGSPHARPVPLLSPHTSLRLSFARPVRFHTPPLPSTPRRIARRLTSPQPPPPLAQDCFARPRVATPPFAHDSLGHRLGSRRDRLAGFSQGSRKAGANQIAAVVVVDLYLKACGDSTPQASLQARARDSMRRILRDSSFSLFL